MAVLLEQHPELRSTLTVAVVGGPSGSGLERPDSLVRLAEELGIDSLVRFVPPVSQDELVDWYAASTLVCVPSYNESFGLVAVEAQATGTPVVAAAVGGLPTAVRDGRSGLLVRRPRAGVLRRGVRARPARARAARPARGGCGGARAAVRLGPDGRRRCSRSTPRAQEKMRADLSGLAL